MKGLLKIGIVGCGTIGGALAKAIDKKFSDKAKLVALCDIEKQKATKVSSRLKSKPRITSLKTLIKSVDLIIEAASASISYEVVKQSVASGKDVMVMSTAGLVGKRKIFTMAKKQSCHIYIPSGAICGLDAIKAASFSRIRTATLTTTKPPRALEGAPYILKKKINLSKIKKETIIFSGNAKEAAKVFPKNINVAAILSLAGIGPQKTKVKIVANPAIKRNTHQVEIGGDFGKVTTLTENVPSPNNPKTSFLAVLSAIATLNNIVGNVRIGA